MAACDECKKEIVSVIVTTIINGQTVSKHLCSECAKKYDPNNLPGLLALILASLTAKDHAAEVACPNCRMTFAEFKGTGRLGCAQCYAAFHDQLQPILLRIHGRVRHAGRRPRESTETQIKVLHINDLRKRLSEAINTEDYETAARLRDEIKAVSISAAPGKEG